MTTDYHKMKVAELKVELKRLGLPQNGLKADLIARLEEASANSESPAEATSEPEVPPAVEDDGAAGDAKAAGREEPDTTSGDAAAPNADSVMEEQNTAETVLPRHREPSPQNTNLKNMATVEDSTVAADLKTPDPQTEASGLLSSSSATNPPPAEIVQDSQSRKRRSITPTPTLDEVASKRARLDDEITGTSSGLSELDDQARAPQGTHEARQTEPVDVEMGDSQSIVPDETPPNKHTSVTMKSETEPRKNFDPIDQTDVVMRDDNKEFSQLDHNTPMDQAQNYREERIELDVEPSIHPATSALYIKNFMRPLRPQAVRDHLADLATPSGQRIDDSTVLDFYLDTIRTHSFVVFTSVSAASRVRAALHNQVWPDETNRKALWVDFMPADSFNDWVDMEESAGRGRGSSGRYEVVYDRDDDGTVVANLEESGAAPPATKPAPAPAQPERKASIPTGPSRGLNSIEGAPTGPRGFQSGRSHANPGRTERFGDYRTTTTYPPVNFTPVSDELVEQRLSAIASSKSQDYDQSRDTNKQYHRYFFENGDRLVNRGPEIFLAIRPPRRERERRRDQQRDDRRHGGGGGGGGGGGRGRNAWRSMPMPHGVPKGGDRYRGGGSSGDYGDRRYGDERNVDRYRGNGYGRH